MRFEEDDDDDGEEPPRKSRAGQTPPRRRRRAPVLRCHLSSLLCVPTVSNGSCGGVIVVGGWGRGGGM